MSEIKGNKKIVGKINAKTLRATTNVPEWLQPLIKENGVYVGTEPPTDPTKLVWINPDGQASDLDLSNYYTKDETDSLIDTAVQDIDLSSYATKVELENYDTSEQVRWYGKNFIIITALFFPVQGFLNALYFTLRSGGKTVVTFLFDSVYSPDSNEAFLK